MWQLSHWLTPTCIMNFSRRRRIVRFQPHRPISAHAGGSSMQRPTLSSRPGIGTGNVNLVVFVLAGQTNFASSH